MKPTKTETQDGRGPGRAGQLHLNPLRGWDHWGTLSVGFTYGYSWSAPSPGTRGGPRLSPMGQRHAIRSPRENRRDVLGYNSASLRSSLCGCQEAFDTHRQTVETLQGTCQRRRRQWAKCRVFNRSPGSQPQLNLVGQMLSAWLEA